MDLSILPLAQPFAGNGVTGVNGRRVSDMSDVSTASPAQLETLLKHYRELFAKLRFLYVDHVTKERFLLAISESPPAYVSVAENAKLESVLFDKDGLKADLKTRKEEVAAMMSELKEQGRSLAQRYEQLQHDMIQMEGIPHDIEALRQTIATLDTIENEPDPLLRLPLQPTEDLVVEREKHLTTLDEEIEAFQSSITSEYRRLEQLQEELDPLDKSRQQAIQELEGEQQQTKSSKYIGHQLGGRGRWLKGENAVLEEILKV
ncbi:hypothetical protein K470DRAFT_214807 [Piedraia hortae CBS 480.64]|uniref:Kinetochore protein Sos7 coiled-coil domain-containing protein n=1 Tax=Piedraia hortae CBS 480.64 TaxID=1314780 RepID=A0A6A7C327_9PEZI|nr:hypothetical protein K470DRAFT_214807 [Piedraia hortae CBS 480.64]